MGAIAVRTASRRWAKACCTSASSRFSPPKRCATAVTSTSSPSGGSSADHGPQRCAQIAKVSRKARSPAGSLGAVAISGQSVRASASIMPLCAPAAAPARLTASIRGPCAVSAISTSGRAASASACLPVTIRQRSIASAGSQMDRMRRAQELPFCGGLTPGAAGAAGAIPPSNCQVSRHLHCRSCPP